jgi:hypothetical protein
MAGRIRQFQDFLDADVSDHMQGGGTRRGCSGTAQLHTTARGRRIGGILNA